MNSSLGILPGISLVEYGLGKIYGPRSAFRPADTCAPEPDIAFVRKERLHLWRGSLFLGTPDLAVEIVSTESIDRDLVLKRGVYERAGIKEYWIIDLLEGRATFLRLVEGRYEEATQESGTVFRSRVIPGFWLDTRWLFGGEHPAPGECLEKILKG